MNAKTRKKFKKASYEGYSVIDIEAKQMNEVYSMLPEDFNIWDWLDVMLGKGYECSLEIEQDTELTMCVLKSINPSNIDAGIFLFSTSFNTLDALYVTWYKFEILGGGQPLKKATPKERRAIR